MGNDIHDKEYIKRLRAAIGPRIRTARKALGMTQFTAAKRIGIAKEYYGRLERGHALPSTETLVWIADAMNVSVDHLLGVEECDPTPEIEPVSLSPQIEYIVDRARDNPDLRRCVVRLLAYCEGIERKRGP